MKNKKILLFAMLLVLGVIFAKVEDVKAMGIGGMFGCGSINGGSFASINVCTQAGMCALYQGPYENPVNKVDFGGAANCNGASIVQPSFVETATGYTWCCRSNGTNICYGDVFPQYAPYTKCSASKLPCNLPWGGTIPAGATIGASSTSSVPCGSTCTSETRTCNNGVLSGSYTNQSCAPASCGAQPVITFTSDKASINAGDPVILTWSTTNTPTSCAATGGGTFAAGGLDGITAPAGNFSRNPASTTTYTITCKKTGHSDVSASVTVTVMNNCAASSVSWTGVTTGCSGPFALIAHGGTRNISSTASGKIGNVTLSCNNGSVSQSGNTCTVDCTSLNTSGSGLSCATFAPAGTYTGLPVGNTVGTFSWTYNGCTGVYTYTGGCSAPSATASFTSASNCTISAGGNSCNPTLTGTVSGLISPSQAVIAKGNPASGSQSFNNGNFSTSALNIPFGSTTFYLRIESVSGPWLDSRTVTASCAAGSSWNGSICAVIAAANCPASTASWSGSASCSGTYSALTSGNGTWISSINGNSGTVYLSCNNGSILQSSPTCAPSCTNLSGSGLSCATWAPTGTYSGLPATYTVGTFSWSYNSCTGYAYTGGCSAPVGCPGGPAPASQRVASSANPALAVWGSGPYTTDSSLAAIARFKGAMGDADLTITDLGCQASFSGSSANGVTTMNYGSWHAMDVTVTPVVATVALDVSTFSNTKVTSSPGSIDCNSGAGTCSSNYTVGTVVTLTGSGTGGYLFTNSSNWISGCDSFGSGNTCIVTMSSARTVTAKATCSDTTTCDATALSSICTTASCIDTCSISHPGTKNCSGSVVGGKWHEVGL